jgi:hypothetical protein
VVYLGELDERGRLGIQQCAAGWNPAWQRGLFQDTTPEYVEVDLKGVRVERSHQFGGCWLGWALLRQLGLHELLPHKRALEKHLKQRLGELFQLAYDLLLYNVTSTYFEGEAANNPQAQRGYSRDHRPDCKQVNIALVVSRSGLPLGYEVFAGNRTDVNHGRRDCGSDGEPVREGESDLGGGRRYILGTAKGMLRNSYWTAIGARCTKAWK